MPQCKSCGQDIAKGLPYCATCGAPVQAERPAANAQSQTPAKAPKAAEKPVKAKGETAKQGSSFFSTLTGIFRRK